MKLILTGCTGFIGGEVLSQCLQNPSVTSIVALSRRKLPDSVGSDGKLKVIVMKDFNAYSEEVVREMEGAGGCIWCMGTTAGIKELEIDYPLAFATAFSKSLLSKPYKFRYIHLSGAATERDQAKALWFKSSMRKIKGQAETNMINFANRDEVKGSWQTLIIKAGFVVNRRSNSPRDIVGSMLGDKMAIGVDELAAVTVDAAMTGVGWESDTVGDNVAMVAKGRELLQRTTAVQDSKK